MRTIIDGIFKNNPLFILVLGLCSSLAVTTTFEKSYMMGLCVLFVLIFSNFIVSLLKKVVPENVKIPVYILIIGTLVTVLGIILSKYVPSLYKTLGVYLSLITVNCIILGRALTIASKESVGKSLLDAIGIGLGFMLSLMLIGFIREILGNNSLTLMDEISSITGYRLIFKNIFPVISIFPIKIFIDPSGAFLTIGFLLAIFNSRRKKDESR